MCRGFSRKVLFEGIPGHHNVLPPASTAAHPCRPAASPRLHSTSDSLGTARSRTGPRQSSAAARSGSTLFFAAGIAAVPFSGRPPITQIRPLCCVISAAPIPQKIPHDMQKQGRMSRWTMISVCWEVCYASPRDTPSTTPISPSSIMRLVPPEEKKGSEMPVLGMVLVTTAMLQNTCHAIWAMMPMPTSVQ